MDHLSAMQRMAASAPMVTISNSEIGMKNNNLVMASLRYVSECSEDGSQKDTQFILIFPRDLSPEYETLTATFESTDMTKVEIANKVMLLALEYLLARERSDVKIVITQQELREAFTTVNEIVPTYSFLPRKNMVGAALSREANAALTMWTTMRRRKHAEWVKANNIKNQISHLSKHRYIYIDASVATKRKLIGVGYVTKDIITDPKTGDESWELGFGSTRTRNTKVRGGSTLAELRAMHHVLATSKVLDSHIRSNRRGFTLVSDSKWGVQLLNSMRHGTKITAEFSVMRVWREAASEIIELVNDIEDVQFKWVKGHGSDMLNDAADRLALAARRNIEFDIPKDSRVEMNTRIVNETVDVLKKQGTKTRISDISHGNGAVGA